MKEMKGEEKVVEDLLEKWPINNWCVAFFNDFVDNNMCKTFNGVIVEARSKPVIAMLEEIRRYVI